MKLTPMCEILERPINRKLTANAQTIPDHVLLKLIPYLSLH